MALYLGNNEVSAASGVPPVVTADDIKTALGYTPADEADIPTVPTALKNPQSLTFTGAATGSYDGSAAKTVNIPTVPTALKNPNALTFTGAVTDSYDGSAAKTVNIPTALKNPNALTITVDGTANSYDGSEAKDIEISTAAKYDKPLRFTDISVPVIRFTADTTYPDYPYAGAVFLASAEIDTTMIPDVVFGLSDAVSGNFAPVAESYVNGQARGVRIFAKTKPTAAVTIKTLTLWRAV